MSLSREVGYITHVQANRHIRVMVILFPRDVSKFEPLKLKANMVRNVESDDDITDDGNSDDEKDYSTTIEEPESKKKISEEFKGLKNWGDMSPLNKFYNEDFKNVNKCFA
ncbi:hypothetical protein SEMRO_1477_G275990.1 [Seminavis robusta]|uniref:Uncharacterized protein n=1 Tax=Seminavis robusta TaxID=568900 RepID=A0A9N8ERU5_9STRA|nr:hypothetical protein SEMRO_1477_G275990.1 [Seminavis robusta]|eukprot:Sro1477_g275990.1 n/a (110) ;mRNA; f:6601-7059